MSLNWIIGRRKTWLNLGNLVMMMMMRERDRERERERERDTSISHIEERVLELSPSLRTEHGG